MKTQLEPGNEYWDKLMTFNKRRIEEKLNPLQMAWDFPDEEQYWLAIAEKEDYMANYELHKKLYARHMAKIIEKDLS